MKYQVQIAQRTFELEVNGEAEHPTLILEGQPVSCDFRPIGDTPSFSLIVENKSYRIWVAPKENGAYVVNVNGMEYEVQVEDERSQLLKRFGRREERVKGEKEIKAPMPGLVVKVEVQEGQEVRRGDGLVIVEAMKMENEIRAPVAGVVRKVGVREGEAIEKDAVLVVIGG